MARCKAVIGRNDHAARRARNLRAQKSVVFGQAAEEPAAVDPKKPRQNALRLLRCNHEHAHASPVMARREVLPDRDAGDRGQLVGLHFPGPFVLAQRTRLDCKNHRQKLGKNIRFFFHGESLLLFRCSRLPVIFQNRPEGKVKSE